ncbi:MAG: hypothetical protein AM326_12275 [Candidatus Thorarchaeota archaeon SMTZ-45]|nr:MAG: hypothetical protein AM326_12275 [Candidatus Thorarchaeota archaeon SMTZ-45]KXH72863.1 MAG: hypothetical protein AM325_16945 [Candidatus Thorarchaeota archaeon SMTZ1-45]
MSGVAQLKKSIAVISILVGLLMLPQVPAQEQYFTWGVTPDLRIRYSVTKTSYFTPPDDDNLFLHEEFEAIASFSYFPDIRPQYWDEYGVDTTIGTLTFVNGSQAPGVILVFPIGNWSLVEASDSISSFHIPTGDVLRNATYFQDERTWGRMYNYTTITYFDFDPDVSYYCNITVTEVFSKTDGAIVLEETIWDFFWDPYNLGRMIQTYARIDEYTILLPETQQLIIISVGVAAVVLLVSFYWLKIKR